MGGPGLTGHSHSGNGTLKLTVSHERMDEINSFFACCYKFRKAEIYLSYSNIFFVEMDISRYGHVVHRGQS